MPRHTRYARVCRTCAAPVRGAAAAYVRAAPLPIADFTPRAFELQRCCYDITCCFASARSACRAAPRYRCHVSAGRRDAAPPYAMMMRAALCARYATIDTMPPPDCFAAAADAACYDAEASGAATRR